MDDSEYTFIKQRVFDLIDIDLDNYKEKQMRRRLSAFIERSKAPDVASYFEAVGEDGRMLQELKDFLTINVSEFFRDQHHFETLRRDILPELLQQRRQLKVWSAGCSNGAEPYTLAIMLEELTPGRRHHIVATDLDETILAQARKGGPYMPQDIRNVKPRQLTRFFRIEGEKHWVTDWIRDRVQFTRHNLLNDPYGTDYDLILCRNVVIYFTDFAKKQINRAFHNALREGGVLFIGGSEIIFDCAQIGFEIICPSFYRKLPAGAESPYAHSKVTYHRDV